MSVQQSLWFQMSQVLFYYQHNSNSNMSLSVCDIKQLHQHPWELNLPFSLMLSDVRGQQKKLSISTGLHFEANLIRFSQNALFLAESRNKFSVEREPAWRPELGFSHVSPAACHFTFGNLFLTLSCTTGALGRCHSSAKHFKADRCPFTSGVGNGAWSSVGVQGPPTHSHDITDSTPTETAWSGC